MTDKEAIEILKDLWRYEHSEIFSEKEIREALEKGIEALKIPITRCPDDVYAIEFSTEIDEPSKWQDKEGNWHKEHIPFTDNWDEICKTVVEMEDKRIYNEMLMKEQIETAVIICNRENKHRLKGLFPNLCVLGTDHCDDKIYMVTDKRIAENIRDTMKWENKK